MFFHYKLINKQNVILVAMLLCGMATAVQAQNPVEPAPPTELSQHQLLLRSTKNENSSGEPLIFDVMTRSLR